jgi:hydrogenase nickel incorporation protein HypA/HybF
MHEMSLAEGVIQLIEDSARQNSFSRVKTVWLEIGKLSGVEAEAMRFCFDAVARGTLAENAALEILETPGAGHCAECHRDIEVTERFQVCPNCGGFAIEVTGGAEMRVKELEVE